MDSATIATIFVAIATIFLAGITYFLEKENDKRTC